VLRQGREQRYATSSNEDSDVDDDDYDDDDDRQLMMSPSASWSLPAELRAVLARERSRRRAAEDWATFLAATLDSFVRASQQHDRRLGEASPNSQLRSIHRQAECKQQPYECQMFVLSN